MKRTRIKAIPATPPTTPPATACVEGVFPLLDPAPETAVDEGEARPVLVAPPPDPPPPPPIGAPAELTRLDDVADDVADDECCEDVEVASEVEVEVRRVEWMNDFLDRLEDDTETVEDPVCEEDDVVVIVGAWVDLDSVVPTRVVVKVVARSLD